MKTQKPAHIQTVFLIGAAISVCFSANAAGPNVDAGSLLRQTEQGLITPKKSPRKARRKVTPSKPATPNEVTVQIRRFEFAGNTLISSDALNAVLESFTNRPLTLSQLKEAADAITTTYREAGWTVNAYLPKQEVSQGVVTIQVVEAVFGGASVQGNQFERVEATHLVNMAEAMLSRGQPIHASDIDRTLLLLDDLPGISVAGNLVAGDGEGETNLVISAVDDALINGNASTDNQGSVATGTDRLSVNLNINSPAGMGDLISINALKTQGSEYQRLAYSVPVGYTAWRAGIHASNLHYNVIAPEFASLNPFGTARTSGLDLSYPIVRSQLQNVNLALSYDDKQFDNSSNGAVTSYGIKVYNATLSANQIDQWNGGGITSASASLTSGDKSTEDRYTKLNLSLSRLQTLDDALSAYAAISTQFANRNLDSSEKMYLGGATGVRAYPASEGGGGEGTTLTLELRQRLAYNLTLTGFYDYGWVKANHDNNVASPANPNGYYLQGYGVSVAWQATQAVDLKATLAQRLGSNPAANSTTGMDGDGTKKVTRIWFSAGVAY